MRLTDSDRIPEGYLAPILDLIARAGNHDGVAPLSEQGLLNLRHPPGEGVRHFVLRERAAAADGEQDGQPRGKPDGQPEMDPKPGAGGNSGPVVGYAQLDARPGVVPAGELVVDPGARRRGYGGQLLDALLRAAPHARIWAHGLLPGAGELARSRGLHAVRDLFKLARPLSAEDVFPTRLPAGYTLATYDPRDPRDAHDWLAVNAAAFATHPEQGRMTLADLLDRQAEPWFDPAGFFLVRDTQGRLAASHWTKVPTPGSSPDGNRGGEPERDRVGEVYVVAVSPQHQGRGLGRAVTAIGLAHLRDLGVRWVELYVDGDNAAAIATYRAQGFYTATRDVQFAAGVSR